MLLCFEKTLYVVQSQHVNGEYVFEIASQLGNLMIILFSELDGLIWGRSHAEHEVVKRLRLLKSVIAQPQRRQIIDAVVCILPIALMALAEKQLAERFREQGLAGFTGAVPTPTPATVPAEMASNCKPAATVPAPASWFSRIAPRNAPCPCGSGKKFKRCCGNPAAQALNQAA